MRSERCQGELWPLQLDVFASPCRQGGRSQTQAEGQPHYDVQGHNLEEDKVNYHHFHQQLKDRNAQKKRIQKAKQHINKLMDDGQKAASTLVLSKRVCRCNSKHFLCRFDVDCSSIPSTTHLYRQQGCLIKRAQT